MAKTFTYTGINSEGKRVVGDIKSKDERQAKRQLRREGIRVKEIKAPNPLDIDLGMLMVKKGLAKPFKEEELSRFTKKLSTLIDAGVPILESLEILSEQEKNNSFKEIIKSITDAVSGGKSLHESINMQNGFGKLYTALVKAGESAGILDIILNKLVEFMERQREIRQKIKKALTYPSIVIVVGIGVITGLMVFVVPQFVEMLTSTGQEVPWVTQTVIDVSDFMSNYFFHLVVGFIAAAIIFNNWKKTKKGKLSWDRIVMKSPVFGPIAIKGELSSFARTLATMLSAGVNIIDSLEICIDTLENAQMQRDLRMVRDAVEKGKSITEPLGRIKYFPPLVNQMMKVGESTGNLDEMLIKVADVFEEETTEAIDTMTSLIEPAILVVLGGIIAFVLIAMYLPIFMAAGGAGA